MPVTRFSHIPGMGSLRWQIGPLGRYLSNEKNRSSMSAYKLLFGNVIAESVVAIWAFGKAAHEWALLTFRIFSGHLFTQMAERTTGPIFE